MLGRILNKNVNFLRKKYTQCAEVPPPTESADAQMAANDPMNDGAGDVGCLQYERFSKEWQEMTMQDNFDGFRLEAGKQVAQNLQASHSLFLGTTLRETGHIYQFGPTFHDPLLGLTLVGRMGFDGGVNARAAQKIGESAEIKLNANSHLKKPDQTMYELSADYAAKDWSACLKTAWQMTWIVNGIFLFWFFALTTIPRPFAYLVFDFFKWFFKTRSSFTSILEPFQKSKNSQNQIQKI